MRTLVNEVPLWILLMLLVLLWSVYGVVVFMEMRKRNHSTQILNRKE